MAQLVAIVRQWGVTLASSGALLVGCTTWHRAIAIDCVPWQRHAAYLHQFRPGTYWTWKLDPTGLVPLAVMGVGWIFVGHRADVRVHGAWTAVSILCALWYLGCAGWLLFNPLVW